MQSTSSLRLALRRTFPLNRCFIFQASPFHQIRFMSSDVKSEAPKSESSDAQSKADTPKPQPAAATASTASSSSSTSGGLLHKVAAGARYVFDAIVGNERRDYSQPRNAAMRPLPADMPPSESTALSVFQKPMTPWERRWRDQKERLERSALYQALENSVKAAARVAAQSDNAVVKGARDLHQKVQHKIEDMREEYETSQDPSIVRAREMSDSLFSESETGAAVGEVRKTDPDFSIRELEMEMQEYMLPIAMKAYLAGDMKFMNTIMEENAMRFVLAEHKQREALGHVPDFFLITLDSVQCASASFQGHIPVFALNFAWQYRHLVRDRSGKIVDGSESSLRTGGGVVVVRRDVESDVFNWKFVDMRAYHHVALL